MQKCIEKNVNNSTEETKFWQFSWIFEHKSWILSSLSSRKKEEDRILIAKITSSSIYRESKQLRNILNGNLANYGSFLEPRRGYHDKENLKEIGVSQLVSEMKAKTNKDSNPWVQDNLSFVNIVLSKFTSTNFSIWLGAGKNFIEFVMCWMRQKFNFIAECNVYWRIHIDIKSEDHR